MEAGLVHTPMLSCADDGKHFAATFQQHGSLVSSQECTHAHA